MFYQHIFTYNPPVENFNNKRMYVLADGDHIYTLNHDLKRLEQTQSEDTDEAYAAQASVDYKLRTDRDIVDYKMIRHIDEILEIIRTTPPKDGDDDQQHVTYLVHQDNDIELLLWQMVESGVTPQKSYQAGRLSWLCIEVCDHKFIIRNQHLSHSTTDGIIETEDVNVYNKMNDSMFDMEMSIFKNEHKSYYSQQDIDILDEYRSVPNVGSLAELNKCSYVEIDIYI